MNRWSPGGRCRRATRDGDSGRPRHMVAVRSRFPRGARRREEREKEDGIDSFPSFSPHHRRCRRREAAEEHSAPATVTGPRRLLSVNGRHKRARLAVFEPDLACPAIGTGHMGATRVIDFQRDSFSRKERSRRKTPALLLLHRPPHRRR